MDRTNLPNYLYVSDLLPFRQENYFRDLEKGILELDIPLALIPSTADIWARDFMPVQVAPNKFVQFTYDPDYLKSHQSLISNVDQIVEEMGLAVEKSTIKLDGGNVVRAKEKVILCDKIFQENASISPGKLIQQLEALFNVSTIIFIPSDSKDIIGHADGYVRFLDDHIVLVNDYGKEEQEYKESLYRALRNAGLEYVPITYNPYGNKSDFDATGIYINYLEMEQGIVLPTFGLKDDENALTLFQSLFPDVSISTVTSNEISKEGGVLNCISWSCKKS